MKKAAIAVLCLIPLLAFAGAIKTWTSGEVIKASDLNTTFQHIHNALRGSGHTLIVDADVSGSAALAHSKLATPSLVPKAWFVMNTCSVAGACTITESVRVTSVTRTATAGQYEVRLAGTASDTDFAVLAQPTSNAGSGPSGVFCYISNRQVGEPEFIVNCSSATDPQPQVTDTGLSVMVLDAESGL